MVTFRPFRGFLPNLAPGEDILDRISPPYDVIDEYELEALRRKERNVTWITLNPVGGRYQEAARELEDWIASGALRQDERPCFYLYRQRFRSNGSELVRTGLVGVLKLEPYSEGNIIPHEETNPWVKEDRLRLLLDTQTHAESIFGLFHHSEIGVDEILTSAEPLFDGRDHDGVSHSFYRIASPQMIERIERMMVDKKILIADGHHRFETALRYAQEHPDDDEKGYVLTTLVSSDDEGMVLLPTHRLIRGIRMDERKLLERLEVHLEMEEIEDLDSLLATLKTHRNKAFGIITRSGRQYLAKMRRMSTENPLWAIDAYACQQVIFKGALAKERGLTIDYEERLVDVRRKMEDGQYDLAMLLGSPTMEDVWKVAEKGIKMPKKSTFFYPKIWSGFVYQRMK